MADEYHDDNMSLGMATDAEPSGDRPFIVDGTYLVTCTAIREGGFSRFARKDSDGNDKRDAQGNIIYPEQWKWVLTVNDVLERDASDEQNALIGQDIWHNTNKGMGPKAHTRAFVEAFVGRPLQDGEPVKLGAVRGKQAKAVIVAKDNGYIKTITLTAYKPRQRPATSTDEPDADERNAIMDALHRAESGDEVAALWLRIRKARLQHDNEVMSVYEMADAHTSRDE